jgi:hypothetical protein
MGGGADGDDDGKASTGATPAAAADGHAGKREGCARAPFVSPPALAGSLARQRGQLSVSSPLHVLRVHVVVVPP